MATGVSEWDGPASEKQVRGGRDGWGNGYSLSAAKMTTRWYFH